MKADSKDKPSPHELYKQTGGGDAYRVAMLEHGHVQPVAPWNRKDLAKAIGKRISVCGLTHEPDWSEWRVFNDAGREFEGRWCRVCARTNVRLAGVQAEEEDEAGADGGKL